MFNVAKNDVATSYSTISLTITGEESLDIFVKGNPIFQSMFYNLLSNMIKYRKTEQKIVTVEIATYSEKKSTHVLLSDYGQGIPPEKREQIFESLVTRPRHTHFGLYLVKAILNLFDGDIWIENRADSPNNHTAGLTFHLSIPSD